MSNEDWEPDPQVMAVVQKELDRLKTVIEFEDAPDDKYNVKWTKEIYVSPYPTGCARLRIDWELVDQESPLTDEQTLDAMLDFALVELVDLLEHGDADDYTNPLLGAIDGKNKLGKELLSVNIPSAVIYREAKPKKKSTEFTFYLLLVPVWG